MNIGSTQNSYKHEVKLDKGHHPNSSLVEAANKTLGEREVPKVVSSATRVATEEGMSTSAASQSIFRSPRHSDHKEESGMSHKKIRS
jgi:hypothetical protein